MGRFLVTHIRPTFAPRAASTANSEEVPALIQKPHNAKKPPPFGSGMAVAQSR